MASKHKQVVLTPAQLNLKLADLEDQGLLAFRDALLDSSFQLIGELIGLMQWTSVEDEGLVVELVRLFRAYGRQEELLLWAIKREIHTTDKAQELFRMQSFATQLLFRFFFDDNLGGQEYLKRTVWRVVDTMADMKAEQLELTPNGLSVSVAEAAQNLEFILDIANDLFSVLLNEIAYFPTVIRKGFLAMKKSAKHKFPDVYETVVPGCFFLRFLSPTLVQPETFGLMKNKPKPEIHKALLILSKLVQNVANGIVKNNITSYAPHDEVILKFIQKHIGTVREFADTLANAESIEAHAKNLAAQKPKETPTEASREEILDRIHQFVLQGQYRLMLDRLEHEQLTQESNEQKRIGSANDFVNSITKHLKELDWKRLKEKHGLTLSALKKTLFWYSLHGRAKLSLDKCMEVLHQLEFRDWMMDVFGEKVVQFDKCLLVDRLEGMKELWSIRFKFPFPHGTRSATVERIFYPISPTEYSMLLIPYMPSDPSQKTNTNATFDAAYFFKEDKDKTSVEISAFYAINPDGTFPPTINVAFAKPFLGGLYALKELLMSGGKTNTRRTRRSNRPDDGSALEKSSPNSGPGVVESSSGGPKKRRRRAQSETLSSSNDESVEPPKEYKEKNDRIALKRLKSLSKRFTRREIAIERENQPDNARSGSSSAPFPMLTLSVSNSTAGGSLGTSRMSARGNNHITPPNLFTPAAAYGALMNEDISLDYDLLSDSDEDIMKTIDYNNAQTRLKRQAVRQFYKKDSKTDDLDDSVDLLEVDD